MRVHFRKTGRRRYGIFVERDDAHDVYMNPAPGYDDYLPHDLLHYVAEAEWGIDDGVFGQLAAGGDAATFIPAIPVGDVPHRFKRRSDRLLQASIARLAPRLDELARRWHDLGEGESLTFEWPLRPKRSSASRASRRDGAGTRARSGARARG